MASRKIVWPATPTVRRVDAFGCGPAQDEEATHDGPLEAQLVGEVRADECHRPAEAGAAEVDSVAEVQAVEGGGAVERGEGEIGRAGDAALGGAVTRREYGRLERGAPGVDVAVDPEPVEVDGAVERHVGHAEVAVDDAVVAPDGVIDRPEFGQIDGAVDGEISAVDGLRGQALHKRRTGDGAAAPGAHPGSRRRRAPATRPNATVTTATVMPAINAARIR